MIGGGGNWFGTNRKKTRIRSEACRCDSMGERP